MRRVVLLLVGLLVVPGCKNESSPVPDAAVVDVLAPDLRQTEPPVTKRDVGGACTADADCVSNLCFKEICRKACSNGPSCKSTEDCVSDGTHPTFCLEKTYSSDLGKSCAVTGTCPDPLKCFGGGAGSATAYCSGECKDNLDCPPALHCRELDDADSPTGKRNYCMRRGFCGRCEVDSQCENGGRCIKQGGESFCTLPCHEGSHECPRVADCKDVGGGDFQCVHRTGSCVGDGTMCSPCTEEKDCVDGAMCIAYYFSAEWFCATSCPTKGQSCEGSTKFQCQAMPLGNGQSSLQCFPYDKDPSKEVSCTKLSPQMQVGDIMDDFAVVGYADDNQSNSLNDERIAGKVKVVKLSDFTSSKIILFNVAAGWCQPCMFETSGFVDLMKKYRANGLTIFQVLFDGANPGDDPTKTFLDKWITPTKINLGTAADPYYVFLNPQGACGIDPERLIEPYNSGTGPDAGSTPLNFILDAKTRKVLAKWNATDPSETETTEDVIRKHLGLPPLPGPEAGPPPPLDGGVKDATGAQ
jgi:thiol-disulfide isomerase/thioredoxin